MAHQRKLGRTAGQRKALLRRSGDEPVSEWQDRDDRSQGQGSPPHCRTYITLAVNECDNTVTTTKITHNDKDQKVELQVVNDAPSKLHARRQMTAYLYNVPQQKLADENKKEYKERTKDVKYPVVEKLFREYGPMFKKRNAEKNVAGGYTRMYKLGPRRGDAAELVMLEIINIPGTDATAEAK